MKRIIVTAILTVVFAIGTVTSFVANDLSNLTQWMQTNEAQFKKPFKHDYHRDDRDKKYHKGDTVGKEVKDCNMLKDRENIQPQGNDREHHPNHVPMNGDLQGQPMNPPQEQSMNPPQGQPVNTPQN